MRRGEEEEEEGDEQRSRMDRGCPLIGERQVRSAWRWAEHITDEDTEAQSSR